MMTNLKINLLLSLSIVIFTLSHASAEEHYYRQLLYNHVSPYVPIVGIHEISKEEAMGESHYLFKYDKQGRISEIISNYYLDGRLHFLASIGAYRAVFTYETGKEIRTYYDKNNQRIINAMNVYKEVYNVDSKGFKYALHYYDLDDEPMESVWNISRYEWKRHKNMVVENRYNLKDEPMQISLFFEFKTTGIVYDKKGWPKAQYNLNDDLEITDNSIGVAAYLDEYAENGDHAKVSYHNSNGNLVLSMKGGCAVIEAYYNENGVEIGSTCFDVNKNEIKKIDVNEVKLAALASVRDSAEIKRIALDYMVALQEQKPELMRDVVHHQLSQKTFAFNRREKKEEVQNTNYDEMVERATSFNKANNMFPQSPANQIVVLDIYNRIATIKLVSDSWVEYMQMIKMEDKWSIINQVWQYKILKLY
ncbi:nuclear transport factor 2 family protein [Fulvivirga ligni]|uniref:nuclear transport factor 2 family protein n=1 Tax=Fulvivirga ligni TaxID=2904246 RepID=UPI001F23B9BA|nr:nuclear transport factor 2 family protein [Fulvivirga ligni]UII23050.1 nuclear transport factor 2 family protein [Fulvivirga ligni]